MFYTLVKYPLHRNYAATRTGLGTVEKRKIFFPCQESSNDSLDVQPVARFLYRLSDRAVQAKPQHSKTVIKHQNQFAGGMNVR